MIKKLLFGLVALYVLFIITGIVLIHFQKITRFTFFPGFSIKYKLKEKGITGTEGPVAIYNPDNLLITTAIITNGTKKVVKIDTLKNGILNCQTFTTKDTFSIPLKSSLSVEPDNYAVPGKMLILSDIEGNFKGFKMILAGAGVINQSLDWTYGNGHLVLVGDFFDRGTDVTACLWLIYKLEAEAERTGGKVHFILGNHEIMNLTGKYHYVNARYQANADTLKLPYNEWYDNDAELGRWLRTKNVAEKIGDILFTHGGIHTAIVNAKLSLADINQIARTCIDKKASHYTADEKLVTGKDGPYWYRVLAQEEASEEELSSILKAFGVHKIIIGHTILGKIKSLYNGNVIVIDLPHQEQADKGFMQALLYQNKQLAIIDNKGKQTKLN